MTLADLPPTMQILSKDQARALGITSPVTARYHQAVAGCLLDFQRPFERDGIKTAIVAIKGDPSKGSAYLELWRTKAATFGYRQYVRTVAGPNMKQIRAVASKV